MRTVHKSFLAALLGLVSVTAAQPEPNFHGKPVIINFTGVTCPTCGDWWPYIKSLSDEYDDDIFIAKVYSYNNNGYLAGEQNLHTIYGYGTKENTTVGVRYPFTFSSIPSIHVNSGPKVMEPGAWRNQINAHLGTTWPMGMNFEAWTEGNSIQIARVFQTNETLTGSWHLNTFITEDNIAQLQENKNGRIPNAVHMDVLRQTSTLIEKNNGIYGTPLPADVLSGTVYRDTVTIPMGDLWVKENLHIGLVLYKNGAIYNAYTRADTWSGSDENGPSSSSSSSSPSLSSSEIDASSSSSSSSDVAISSEGDASGIVLPTAGKQSLQLHKADAQGISFTLLGNGTTTLQLVTITGRQLFEKTVAAEGTAQEVSWGRALNKGIYFATLKSSLGARHSIRFVVR